jgi:hypothetical protein
MPHYQNTHTKKTQEIQQLAAAANGSGSKNSAMIPPETMESAAIAAEQAAKVKIRVAMRGLYVLYVCVETCVCMDGCAYVHACAAEQAATVGE